MTSPSGKRYVGIGMGMGGIKERWDSYRTCHCKKQRKLYAALKKYGPENFKYEVILETDDRDNANRSEMYLIDVWNLQDNRYGYNINPGGDTSGLGVRKDKRNMYGRVISEETRLKMRLAKLGKKRPPVTLETRIKMSITIKQALANKKSRRIYE